MVGVYHRSQIISMAYLWQAAVASAVVSLHTLGLPEMCDETTEEDALFAG